MISISQPQVTNQLLALLDEADFSLVAQHLRLTEVLAGHVLAEPDMPIADVYFPASGLISLVTVTKAEQQVEAGLFGREGVGPLNPLLGSLSTPNRVVSQIAGVGWLINAEALVELADARQGLRSLILRYAHTLSIQMTFTAMSNAAIPAEERLARWLLMCDDRCDFELPLTHTLIATMLAVRRPTVTTAMHILTNNGFIKAERGNITVVNRRGLEEFAGPIYGKPEAEYRRLIGPIF